MLSCVTIFHQFPYPIMAKGCPDVQSKWTSTSLCPHTKKRKKKRKLNE